jgi:iron complex outermembrane receptor protein
MGMIARIGLAAVCGGLWGTGWAATAQARVYERDEVARSGLATIAEFLARQPWAGSGQSPRLNGGGLGTETIDVGELGELRTEVLVDGRRWIADLEGGFDLGAIPLSSVERIVVTLGGRGVGGTLDIMLRAPVDGVEARSGVGEFTAGDGRREFHGVRIGATGERGAAQVEASYAKQEGLLAADRDVSRSITPGFDPNDVRSGASSTTPFGRFLVFPPGVPVLDRVLTPGRPGNSAADFRAYAAASDGYNVAADENLRAPSDQTVLRASGHYAVVDGITARLAVVASERRSEQRFGGVPLRVGGLAPDPALRAVDLSASAFNPFRVTTIAQFRPVDLDRVFAQDTDTVAFDAGLDGTFELLAREWRWHAGWRDADRERADTTTGYFDTARLAQGLGPSFRAADGSVRCGTPQAPIAGCVPINIFGGPAGFTPAMRDYAGVVLQSAVELAQTQYFAGLDGVLLDLPAGPLSLSLDVEHRRESGAYVPDALIAARGTEASNAFGNLPYGGRIASDHVDLGFDVPLLREASFARALDLAIGAAWLDDDDTGSETSPRVALRWAPVDALRIDAGWARQARAPSLLERFEAATQSFVPFLDPCSIPLLEAQPAEVQQRCRGGIGGVPGVPVGYGQAGTPGATFGGGLATGLDAERATRRRLAIEYAPTAWPDARVALAWNRIRIDDVIGVGTVQAAFDACYLAGDLDACRRIARQAGTGEITRVFAGWQNLAVGLETETWDLGLDFGHDTAFGRFDLRLDASYLSYLGEAGQPDRGELLPDGNPAQGNIAGVFRGDLAIAPRLRARIALDWTQGDWSATLGYGWRSSLVEDCGAVTSAARAVGDPARAAILCSDPVGTPRFPNGANRIASHGTADVQLRWETPWDGQVALGIHNLFDHDPPTSYASGNGNLLVIDPLPGRAWWASVAQRW